MYLRQIHPIIVFGGNKKATLIGCCSCGGRIRTCDLQVMSLASYQLLHSAMLFF